MSSGNAKIGHPAPNFKATAVMPDGQFKDISLSDYKGKSMLDSGKWNCFAWPVEDVSQLVI